MKLIHKVADCDLHPGRPATYDEPLAPRGQWGNVCDECHDSLSLGSTAGYRLTRGEVAPTSAADRLHAVREANPSTPWTMGAVLASEAEAAERRAIRSDLIDALEDGDHDAAMDIIGDGDIAEWL